MAEIYEDDGVQFDDDPLDDDTENAQEDLARINAPDPQVGTHVTPEQLAQYESAMRVISQFNANPLSAMQQMAEQMGMELRHKEAPGPTPKPAQPSVEDMIDDPSMKFLAPLIAKVAQRVADQQIQERLAPLQRSQEEISTRNRQAEYVLAAQQLASRVPDWQTREPDMQARLDFIKQAVNGGPLVHHKYGNILDMLYDWASGKNNAVREVAGAYRDAPRTRGRVSTQDESRRPDIMKIVAKANPRDQMRIAFDEAVREVIG